MLAGFCIEYIDMVYRKDEKRIFVRLIIKKAHYLL